LQARVLVECKGPAREVETALSRVSGVANVEILNGDAGADKHYVTAALRPKEAYDVREEVARTILQNGWPLREIRLEHATLEEFFVQVTASQAMANAARASGGAA
jgi:copper chaperone CopZ